MDAADARSVRFTTTEEEMKVARFTLTLGVFLLSANGVVAQNGFQTTSANPKATSLLARADQIQELDAWSIKARLYEQAAESMTQDDPSLPATLLMAGSTYYHLGNKAAGARLLEQAAVVADRQGNTAAAVDAYYMT